MQKFKKFIRKTLQENSDFLYKVKPIALTVIFLAIIVDIFFIKKSSDFIIFGLLAFYIACIFVYNLKSKLTLLFCLVLLGIMFVLLLLTGGSSLTEKSAVWLYFFLLIGIIQQFRE